MKSVWDKQWAKMNKNVFRETSLDLFAERAFSCFGRWISGNDKSILEAGSGTGRYCIALAHKYPSSRVVGMDISRSAVKLTKEGVKIRKIENVEPIQGNVFKMPFRDNFFDVVFNDGVIEHFHNFEDAMDEMIRVTRPGGKVIIAVPNWYCFPHTIYKSIVGEKYVYGYEKSFKHSELIELFESRGLKGVKISGFHPTHSINRLSRFLYPLGCIIDRLVVAPLDRLTNKGISRMFGIEIVIKGVK